MSKTRLNLKISPIKLTSYLSLGLIGIGIVTSLVLLVQTIVAVNKTPSNQANTAAVKQQNLSESLKLLQDKTLEIDNGN